MVDGIRKLLTVALTACLIGGLSGGQNQARAQTETEAAAEPAAPAGSVLRLARGLASDNITVLIGRAIVVESTRPFIEVSIANPNVADVSPLSDRTIYIFGKNRGATSLTLLGENGALITNVTVKVIPDLSELKAHLRDVFPNEPIEVRLSGSGVLLSGTVSGAAKIERAMGLARSYVGDSAINMMRVGGTQQVMLKVRVAEMSRNFSKNLGFDIGISGDGNDVSGFGVSGPSQAASASEGGGLITVGPTGLPLAASSTAFGGIGVIAELGDVLIDALLSAAEGKGFARTLAEPNLVALSGNQARFLAGQEVPVPAGGEEGAPDIEFKEVGVALNFVPTVIDDNLINLELSAEVSAVESLENLIPTGGGGATPIFNVRRATTAIELRDGESFAIAGLIEDNFTDSISQFPWLGDLPVLGTLFRSTDFNRDESELVIIVSAHLVTPVDESELAVPSDHVRIPNEFELFLMGKPEVGGAPGMVQSQGFDGDFGYVVE